MLDRRLSFLDEKYTTTFATTSLSAMAAGFFISSRIRAQLKNDGSYPYCAAFTFCVADNKCAVSAIFKNGYMTVRPWAVPKPDVTVRYRNTKIMRDLLSAKPKRDLFNAMLVGDMIFEGNLSHLARFSFLTTELIKPKAKDSPALFSSPKSLSRFTPTQAPPHEDVNFLKDIAFSDQSIENFPRLKKLWTKHFTTRPSICSERARLVTEFYKHHGFEKDSNGENHDPVRRQGLAIKYLLQNKEARIEPDDLLLGTTTTKRIGVVIYPEFGGIAIWPELNTVSGRDLNPYDIDNETKKTLNENVFPFWIDRNIREYARKKNQNPLCQRLEERWVLYFLWKVHAISHTIPDFPTLLSMGVSQMIEQAKSRFETSKEKSVRNFHKAVVNTLEGVLDYSNRLADEANQVADKLDPEKDSERIEQLRAMAERIGKVPAKPASTFAEALNAIWILWVCLHQENMNAGLSIGRLDSWLQPYLAADLNKDKNEEERQKIIHDAIELCGAFFLKCQDHLPLVPDIGNRLFGGSSSDQVITVGGVDANGNNAVNDTTYIILKVAEMLGLRDPNLNARYNRKVNPKQYLRRLIEVNAITSATPSIHNDEAVISSIANQGIALEDARDWSATGCVEPTSCGRHMGHTNCMLLNLVAPLEIALNNGIHPLLGETIGHQTGDLRKGGAPERFEDFVDIYKKQLKLMIDYSIEYNNQLGYVHQELHPTPLLSSLIQGTSEAGKDVTFGGAKYNSSGAALVALTDVVDSLMTIKTLIYDRKKISWTQLLEALDKDFAGDEKLHAMINAKVPKFGGDDATPMALAQDLIDFIYHAYHSQKNYRGGRYTCGFWSMSNHVAFGVLSGALPSGRKKGKAFTPGITPSTEASRNILDPLHAVGALDPLKMPNNIAFNVKLFPSPNKSDESFLDSTTDLVESYIKLGGMQLQFNIMTSQTLKDAMKNPSEYRNLLVRISGYNAYFVELNQDMQTELIERSEFSS